MSVEGTRRRVHPSGYDDGGTVDYDEFVSRPEGHAHAFVTCTIGRGAVSVTRAVAVDASPQVIADEKTRARAGLVGVLRDLADKVEAFGHAIAPDAVQS